MAEISIIAAMDENRVIGKDNALPWNIPEDLKWFKDNTKGKVIVMGRKTHESIGRALPYRTNVVLSRNPDYKPSDQSVYVSDSLWDIYGRWYDTEEIIAIGGADIYKMVIPHAQRMYLTRIYDKFDGDTFFPEYDESRWEAVTCEVCSNDKYTYEFKILELRVCEKPQEE